MPTKRKTRTRRLRETLAAWQWEYLATGEVPAEDGHPDPWGVFIFCYGGSTAVFLDAKDTWPLVRDRMLADWIARHPGTRPWAWWQYDAPRKAGHSKFADPRRRLGGTGTPRHEVYNYAPSYSYGAPDGWLDDLDENNPPLFEAQAAYLRRHKLLPTKESASIPISAFDPVPLAEVCER